MGDGVNTVAHSFFFALMAVFSGLMIVANTVFALNLLVFNRVGGFLSSENSIFLLI